MIKTITNENTILFCFEIIRESMARSVLDIGVLLKRMGVISRQVRNLSFSDEIRLVGVEPTGFPHIGVYDTIYDRITNPNDIVIADEFFDLAIVVSIEDMFDLKAVGTLFEWLNKHAAYIATDEYCEKMLLSNSNIQIQESKVITVEKNTYYFNRMEN